MFGSLGFLRGLRFRALFTAWDSGLGFRRLGLRGLGISGLVFRRASYTAGLGVCLAILCDLGFRVYNHVESGLGFRGLDLGLIDRAHYQTKVSTLYYLYP